jgi:hypothetical protein
MPKLLGQLDQTLLDIPHPRIQVRGMKDIDLTATSVEPFVRPGAQSTIGIAQGYSFDGKLVVLAIADEKSVLLVKFSRTKIRNEGNDTESPRPRSAKLTAALNLLQDDVLNRPQRILCAFDMAPIAMSLFLDHGIRITNGADIQSVCLPNARGRLPLSSIKFAVGDSCPVNDENIVTVFENSVFNQENSTDFALRAWIAQHIARLPDTEDLFQRAPKVNTTILSDQV